MLGLAAVAGAGVLLTRGRDERRFDPQRDGAPNEDMTLDQQPTQALSFSKNDQQNGQQQGQGGGQEESQDVKWRNYIDARRNGMSVRGGDMNPNASVTDGAQDLGNL